MWISSALLTKAACLWNDRFDYWRRFSANEKFLCLQCVEHICCAKENVLGISLTRTCFQAQAYVQLDGSVLRLLSYFSLCHHLPGVHNIAYAFPKVRMVTTAVDPSVNEQCHIIPGIGKSAICVLVVCALLVYVDSTRADELYVDCCTLTFYVLHLLLSGIAIHRHTHCIDCKDV